MILQFIGFFVVFGGGAWVLWWTVKEAYNFLRYQVSIPIDGGDVVSSIAMIILMCIGCGLMYYASIHAPFAIVLDFNLKV